MNSDFAKIFLVVAIFSCGIFAFTANAQTLPAPYIFVSSNNLSQADTLLVMVKNENGKVSGTLGNVKLHFQKSENPLGQFAIVGIPVNKKPGEYILNISVEGKAPFQQNITVAKRDFPITEMAITPRLQQQGFTGKKIIKNIEAKENVALNKILNKFTPAAYFTKPFQNPLTEITVVGDYGDIRQSGKLKIQHLGVDLKAATGTPVLAANDGKVVFEKLLPDYGNTLIIDHGLGIYSLYLHLVEFSAKTGDMVKQGDTIALSGQTGYATGPHLHFSIKIRRTSVDPLKFITATQTKF